MLTHPHESQAYMTSSRMTIATPNQIILQPETRIMEVSSRLKSLLHDKNKVLYYGNTNTPK